MFTIFCVLQGLPDCCYQQLRCQLCVRMPFEHSKEQFVTVCVCKQTGEVSLGCDGDKVQVPPTDLLQSDQWINERIAP